MNQHEAAIRAIVATARALRDDDDIALLLIRLANSMDDGSIEKATATLNAIANRVPVVKELINEHA